MKLPFVSRKKYEAVVASNEFLHKELNKRFSLTIPMITLRGIGDVQVIGTKETIEYFQEYLKRHDVQWKRKEN